MPQKLGVINWNGVLSPKLFATAQWSRKKFGFRNSGGKSTLLRDSPFRTPGGNGIPQSLSLQLRRTSMRTIPRTATISS